MTGAEIPQWLPTHLEERYGARVTGLHRRQTHNPNVLRVDREDGPSWVARVSGPERPAARVHHRSIRSVSSSSS